MGAAVAIIIRKEKDIVEAFRRAKATSSATAVSLADVNVDERVPFRILRRRNVVREAEPRRFYLDEAAWAAATRQRRRRLYLVLAFVVAAALLMYYSGTRLRT